MLCPRKLNEWWQLHRALPQLQHCNRYWMFREEHPQQHPELTNTKQDHYRNEEHKPTIITSKIQGRPHRSLHLIAIAYSCITLPTISPHTSVLNDNARWTAICTSNLLWVCVCVCVLLWKMQAFPSNQIPGNRTKREGGGGLTLVGECLFTVEGGGYSVRLVIASMQGSHYPIMSINRIITGKSNLSLLPSSPPPHPLSFPLSLSLSYFHSWTT